MMKSFTCTIILLIAMLSVLAFAAIDEDYEFADTDSVWSSDKDQDQDQAIRFLRLSSAEQSAAIHKREAILEVLRSSKVFNPLGKGLAFQTFRSVQGWYDQNAKPDTRSPLELIVRLRMGHFKRDKTSGNIRQFYMEVPYIKLKTNGIMHNFPFKTDETDDQGHEFILEPYATAATDNGLKIYYLDEMREIVFITNGRPLWIPATSEQFLRAKMKTARQWRVNEIEESRSNGNPPPSENESISVRTLQGYEKEMAELTPAARQRPAFYVHPQGEDFLKSGLAQPGEPGARPVVILNKENYYNPTLPRTAIQLIICSYEYNVPYRSDEPEHVHNSMALSRLNYLAKHLEYEKLELLIEK